jgi:hypothetical protein
MREIQRTFLQTFYNARFVAQDANLEKRLLQCGKFRRQNRLYLNDIFSFELVGNIQDGPTPRAWEALYYVRGLENS